MELPGDLQKQNIMSLNVKLIQACGYLREDCVNTRRVTTFITGTIKYLFMLLFASFLLGAVVELYRLHNTPHDLGESIVFIITITKTMTKMTSLIQNKSEYLHLIQSFGDFSIHGSPLTMKQSSIIKSYLSQANKLIKCIWYPSIIMTFTFLGKITPPADRDRDFVPAWEASSRVTVPFQTASSPFYAFRVVYATVVTAGGYFLTTLLNTFGFLLVIYETAQFALLADTLKHASENVMGMNVSNDGTPTYGGAVNNVIGARLHAVQDNLLDKTTRDAGMERLKRIRRENLKHGGTLEAECEVEHLLEDSEERFLVEMHKYLKRCIEYHQKLLRNTNLLNRLLGPLMFWQILSAGILIGFMGFNLTSAQRATDFMHSAGYVTHLMVETGTICWLATGLTTQSDNVGEAAYFCDWYKQPIRFQRSILNVMARARRPVQISVRPLGILSLELFATILNSSYSYFTIMRGMTN